MKPRFQRSLAFQRLRPARMTMVCPSRLRLFHLYSQPSLPTLFGYYLRFLSASHRFPRGKRARSRQVTGLQCAPGEWNGSAWQSIITAMKRLHLKGTPQIEFMMALTIVVALAGLIYYGRLVWLLFSPD
jgi:hypothetical protein